MKSSIYLILLIIGSAAFGEKIIFANIPRVETLYSLSFSKNDVLIQVESNGCTSNQSFSVQKFLDRSDDTTRLLFVRVRPDWCKAFYPEGVWLRFSKHDLGILDNDIVHIENTFGPNPQNRN